MARRSIWPLAVAALYACGTSVDPSAGEQEPNKVLGDIAQLYARVPGMEGSGISLATSFSYKRTVEGARPIALQAVRSVLVDSSDRPTTDAAVARGVAIVFHCTDSAKRSASPACREPLDGRCQCGEENVRFSARKGPAYFQTIAESSESLSSGAQYRTLDLRPGEPSPLRGGEVAATEGGPDLGSMVVVLDAAAVFNDRDLAPADIETWGRAMVLANVNVRASAPDTDSFAALAVSVMPTAGLAQLGTNQEVPASTPPLEGDPDSASGARTPVFRPVHTCASAKQCPTLFKLPLTSEIPSKPSPVNALYLSGGSLRALTTQNAKTGLKPLTAPSGGTSGADLCKQCKTTDVDYCGGIDASDDKFNCQDFASASLACAKEKQFDVRAVGFSCTRLRDGERIGHAINVLREVYPAPYEGFYRYCAYEPQRMDGEDCGMDGYGHMTTPAIKGCWMTQNPDAYGVENLPNKADVGCAADRFNGNSPPAHESCSEGGRPWFKNAKLRWFGTEKGLSDFFCQGPNPPCGACPEKQPFQYELEFGKTESDGAEVRQLWCDDGKSCGNPEKVCGAGCLTKSALSRKPPSMICNRTATAVADKDNFVKWTDCQGEQVGNECRLKFNYDDQEGPLIKKRAVAETKKVSCDAALGFDKNFADPTTNLENFYSMLSPNGGPFVNTTNCDSPSGAKRPLTLPIVDGELQIKDHSYEVLIADLSHPHESTSAADNAASARYATNSYEVNMEYRVESPLRPHFSLSVYEQLTDRPPPPQYASNTTALLAFQLDCTHDYGGAPGHLYLKLYNAATFANREPILFPWWSETLRDPTQTVFPASGKLTVRWDVSSTRIVVRLLANDVPIALLQQGQPTRALESEFVGLLTPNSLVPYRKWKVSLSGCAKAVAGYGCAPGASGNLFIKRLSAVGSAAQ